MTACASREMRAALIGVALICLTASLGAQRVTVDGKGLQLPPDLGPNPKATSLSIVFPTDADPIHVLCDASTCGGASAFLDRSSFVFGTTAINVIGGVFDDTPPAVLTTGTAGAPRLTAYRGLHSNPRNSSGVELATLANPFRIDPTGTTTQPVSFTRLNFATDSIAVATNGFPLGMDLQKVNTIAVPVGAGNADSATQRVILASDQPAVAVTAASLPLPSGAATSGNQATEIVSLASIDSKITTLQTKLDTLDGDFRNQQLSSALNYCGGWPCKTAKSGVLQFATDPVSTGWLNGFGAQNGMQFGPGPSGPNTPRFAEANDVVNVAPGMITSAASVIGPMSLDGAAGVECFVGAGFTGTLLFQYGPDAAGTYGWNTATTQFAGGTTALPSFTGAASSVNPLLGQGARFLKVSVLIYTSGQAPAICLATKIMSPLAIPGLTIAVPTAAVPALAMETHDITREPKVCTFGYGGAAALGTTLSLCMAAPGASLRNYIVDVEFISTTATASTVQFKSGTQTTTPCDTSVQNISVAYATPISTATPTRFSFQLGDGSTPLNQQICVVGGSATNTTALKVTGFVSR